MIKDYNDNFENNLDYEHSTDKHEGKEKRLVKQNHLHCSPVHQFPLEMEQKK